MFTFKEPCAFGKALGGVYYADAMAREQNAVRGGSREGIRSGIGEARLQGKHLDRPVTVGRDCTVRVSKAEIARRLEIGRTPVRRILV